MFCQAIDYKYVTMKIPLAEPVTMWIPHRCSVIDEARAAMLKAGASGLQTCHSRQVEVAVASQKYLPKYAHFHG
jgi:hypothetical protein